jgi:hypothetical protein
MECRLSQIVRPCSLTCLLLMIGNRLEYDAREDRPSGRCMISFIRPCRCAVSSAIARSAAEVKRTFPADPEHRMLRIALGNDDIWDVVMIGFHMMHQNARTQVYPQTIANLVGTLIMFAVRNIFSRAERLRAELRTLAAEGQVAQWLADNPDPFAFLVHEGGATSVTDTAYRFVRHEPGVEVLLFGTGDREHLRRNIGSILAPPLPMDDRQRTSELFGHLAGIGLDQP